MSADDHVVHVDELAWSHHDGDGERFEADRKKLAAATNADKLGASLYRVPPGKTAWPRHYHLANEEAIFVLSGEGTLRLGDDRTSVGTGDYVALPPGESGAHQLINDGDEPLRYLCLSTMEEPEVIRYPDSEKVGVMAGSAPGSNDARTYNAFHRVEDAVGYWKGEE
jgi:uncharacterized cupin superfamily protein